MSYKREKVKSPYFESLILPLGRETALSGLWEGGGVCGSYGSCG